MTHDADGHEKAAETYAGMPGMSAAPSGAVVIPAVMRQLIGVRSAPASIVLLGQEIRAVGTVGYDERGFTQVTVKTSGWVREVFVDSIGRPVRKGEPLFTLYSPDLLATQDEYLLAVRTQGQLAASPLAEVKANAASLVASTRERLRLWDVTDAQMAALERRGKAEPVLTVYAPSSGIVLKREAVPGKYVEPGTTLYEVADLSTVWISADIYESEVAAVTLNQPASVTFAAYPGETFRGHGFVHLPHAEYRGPHGARAVGNAESWAETEAGHVRNRHLADRCGEDVGCAQGSRAGHRTSPTRVHGSWRRAYAPYPVKLGRRSQDSVEVLEGLKEGDRIVTSANFLLDAESKLASASSMQAMMGRIGMGDWQMRGAYEGKMEGMDMGEEGHLGSPRGGRVRKGMKGMEGMKGPSVPETRKVAGFSLALTTVPENPKAGNVLLKLTLTDQAGKPVTNAQVVFVYTMPMPGMTDSKVTARPHQGWALRRYGAVRHGRHLGGDGQCDGTRTAAHCRKVSVLGGVRRLAGRTACNPGWGDHDRATH